MGGRGRGGRHPVLPPQLHLATIRPRRCHRTLSTFFTPTFSQLNFLDEYIPENSGFVFICEIECCHVFLRFERVQIRPGALVFNLQVDLVLPYHGFPIQAIYAEEVRSLRVVLDQAEHSRVLLLPFRMTGAFSGEELDHCCR